MRRRPSRTLSRPGIVRPPLRLFLAAAASFSLAAAAQQPPAESPGSHWYGYEIMLGNGGSTLFWDAACFSLIEHAAGNEPAFLIRVHDTPLQQKLNYYEERPRPQ